MEKKNQSKPIWDVNDVAFIYIDYQPDMFKQVRSNDTRLIELNAVFLARLATKFKIPVILSCVGVAMGVNQPTIPALVNELPNSKEIDRSTMNAWEVKGFVEAVKATGKNKLVIFGLYTEICLAYPALDAISEGFEVMFVCDAIGGMSSLAHDIAVQRMIQAGAIPNTTGALFCELFRDWVREPYASIAKEEITTYAVEFAKLYQS
ncbi:MAG: isochorismatase family protein [Limnohabitans sp.]|nr:isochorismatase family protein [Limnohabitans sp.]